MQLKEKLENLKKQQEQARELFIKCQGAIELLESMEKESQEESKDKKDTKSDDVIDLPEEIPVKKKDDKPKKKSLTINDFEEGMNVEWVHFGKKMTGIIGKINKRKKKKIEVVWDNGEIKEVNIDKLKIIK